MSRPRLGLRALLQATCEAWDQVEGPSLGAAVLAVVRERPRLRAIINDMREGIESLKAARDLADDQGATARKAYAETCDALAASKKQEQILKDCLADIRLQRDRAEIEVDRLSTALAQSDAAANSLLSGLEDCRHALAECTALREQLLFALGLETSLRTTAQLVAEVIESREEAREERDRLSTERNAIADAAGERGLCLASHVRHLRTRGDTLVEQKAAAIAERDAARIERDRALTENRGARDILRVPAGGDLVNYTKAATNHIDTLIGQKAAVVGQRDNLRASLTVMEAEVARLQARENAKDVVVTKTDEVVILSGTGAGLTGRIGKRPQPGDAVPWAEVEDGALYQEDGIDDVGVSGFHMIVSGGGTGWMTGNDDPDIDDCVNGSYQGGTSRDNLERFHGGRAVLVARNLGSDPEAWRAAMREWTANGNRPSVDPTSTPTAAAASEDAG